MNESFKAEAIKLIDEALANTVLQAEIKITYEAHDVPGGLTRRRENTGDYLLNISMRVRARGE